MELSDEEIAMRDGQFGRAVSWAISSQIEVGRALNADRFVEVSSAHMTADMEVLRDTGLEFLQQLARAGVQVRVPTTTNARCVDFLAAKRLHQNPRMVRDEARVMRLLREMGVVLTDTCVNYQTVTQPTFGDHIAWGDTGTVIYANSIFGARSNYESGPAALAAAITGRTPNYGFHRAERRRGTVRVRLRTNPRDLADWGAIGGVVGRLINDYWGVPVFVEGPLSVSGDELKHLGAALASYGSLAMFHMVGVTPEAPDESAAFRGTPPVAEVVITDSDLDALYQSDTLAESSADVVAMSGPQLSVFELRTAAELLRGRAVHSETVFVITTNVQNLELARRLGYIDVLEEAGALVLAGTCIYLMDLPAMRRSFGWRTLVTNSAKLANIVGGYGLEAAFRRTEACVSAAVTGVIPSA